MSTTSAAPAAKTAGEVPRPTVAICAITFRRPEWLERMLLGLSRLEFVRTKPHVKIVIVENEAGGPAAAICDAMRSKCPFPLHFGEEPPRGIPYARDRSLAIAGDVDFYAILDDDESPDPKWLDELLAVQAAYDADLVAGPVLPVFETPPPSWVEQGAFHQRKRFVTGTRTRPNGTNNVLIRRAALPEKPGPFDVAYALSGSDDTHLFKRMDRAGCLSVWCDEAIVYETIPASRTSVRWLCRRSFRTGTGFAAITLEIDAAGRPRWYLFYLGLKHVVRGLLGMIPGVFLGRAFFVAQLMIMYSGFGMLAGLSGRQYQEYKTIHGQ
jgi:glycosyltransferase involved in cell wall biosynthesis